MRGIYTKICVWLKPHKIFLALLGIFLALFAWNICRTQQWSAWKGGDAQTILTLRYWERDGFFDPHKFLFTVHGYTPWLKIFDATDLQAHALGSYYYAGGQLIQRVYYSHYPSFYAAPLAVFVYFFGSENRMALHLIQLLVSVVGVLFLYLFLFEVAKSKAGAAIGTFAFLLSSNFIDWAHSLANMPIDDLFRNLFLLLSVRPYVILNSFQDHDTNSTFGGFVSRCRNKFGMTYWNNALMWFTYFALSLVSLDSIFFCAAWLVGLDLINRKFAIKKWMVFALAPVLARVVQTLQTASEFGFTNTFQDLQTRFVIKAAPAGMNTILERLASVSREFKYMLGFWNSADYKYFLHAASLAAIILLVGGLVILWRKSKDDADTKLYLMVIVLFIAGSIFGLVFPGASWMKYEGRQFIPFYAASIAVLVRSILKRDFKLGHWLMALPVAFIIIYQLVINAQTIIRGYPVPMPVVPPQKYADFGRELHKYVDNRSMMIFVLDPKFDIIRPADVISYMVDPSLVYEADVQVLGFKDQASLDQDMKKIMDRTGNAVLPYIVASGTAMTTQLSHNPEPIHIYGRWYGASLKK